MESPSCRKAGFWSFRGHYQKKQGEPQPRNHRFSLFVKKEGDVSYIFRTWNAATCKLEESPKESSISHAQVVFTIMDKIVSTIFNKLDLLLKILPSSLFNIGNAWRKVLGILNIDLGGNGGIWCSVCQNIRKKWTFLITYVHYCSWMICYMRDCLTI